MGKTVRSEFPLHVSLCLDQLILNLDHFLKVFFLSNSLKKSVLPDKNVTFGVWP